MDGNATSAPGVGAIKTRARPRLSTVDRHDGHLRVLISAVTDQSGASAPALRRAIVDGLRSRRSLVESGLPHAVRAYVEQVAVDATRVTTDDIEPMRRAGLNEEVIFELTVAAALGASLARLDRCLEVMALEG